MSARAKRAAEDYARTRDIDGQRSKKPRFDVRNPSALAPDALEDDAFLEADVIGNRGVQVRRGAVNIDGYESDSENDNFNARAEARAKENKTSKEDENDMFAALAEDFEGDDSEGTSTQKKKAVRFLDKDEIEGQVKSSKSGGHVSANFRVNGKAAAQGDVESSSESEVDDETRASTAGLDPELGAGSKKSHAPKLDAFHMDTELDEGRFDAEGNYVRKAADPDAIYDVWLEGVSKKEMRKAKEAADKRDQERRKRALEDDAKSTGQILQIIIPLLQPGETILEALARLGKGKEKKKPKWQTHRKRPLGEEAPPPAPDGDAERERREKIEIMTGAADLLLTRGQTEIYDAERELLIRQYRRETGHDWIDSTEPPAEEGPGDDSALWEYRWTDARDGGLINGPFDQGTMKQWNEAGYFGEGVEFRQQGATNWTRVAEFTR